MFIQTFNKAAKVYASTANLPVVGDTEKLYRVGDTYYYYQNSTGLYLPIGGGSFPQAQYLTLALDGTLTNERVFVPGTNLVGVDSGAGGNYTLSAQIGALQPNSIVVTPSTRQDNYNPTGWNGTYPNISTSIFFNPTTHIVVGGLQGGGLGRIVWLRNVSNFLIILENEGTGSTASNRFNFGDGFPRYLTPGRSIGMIYDTTSNRWILFMETKPFDYFEDFGQDIVATMATNTSILLGSASGYCTGTTGVIGGQGTSGTVGSVSLVTGTNAAGAARVSFGPRNALPVDTSTWMLSVNRLSISNLPTAAEEFSAVSGLNQMGLLASYSTNEAGVYWETYRTTSASNWTCVAGNAGSIIRTDSLVPMTASQLITLGVYHQGTANQCFFYSTDGITYTIALASTVTMSVGASLSMAGIFKRGGSPGTADRRVRLDYLAASYKYTR